MNFRYTNQDAAISCDLEDLAILYIRHANPQKTNIYNPDLAKTAANCFWDLYLIAEDGGFDLTVFRRQDIYKIGCAEMIKEEKKFKDSQQRAIAERMKKENEERNLKNFGKGKRNKRPPDVPIDTDTPIDLTSSRNAKKRK